MELNTEPTRYGDANFYFRKHTDNNELMIAEGFAHSTIYKNSIKIHQPPLTLFPKLKHVEEEIIKSNPWMVKKKRYIPLDQMDSVNLKLEGARIYNYENDIICAQYFNEWVRNNHDIHCRAAVVVLGIVSMEKGDKRLLKLKQLKVMEPPEEECCFLDDDGASPPPPPLFSPIN